MTKGQQIFQVRMVFPQMQHSRSNGVHIWLGTLQPAPDSVRYTIRIEWRPQKPPKVFVVDPALVDNAPHRYNDNSLCLYDHREQPWRPTDLVARTIIPWTAEWLYWYEVWLEYGEWMGPEASHTGPKELE